MYSSWNALSLTGRIKNVERKYMPPAAIFGAVP